MNSVVQALPTFTMSVFMLSKGLCDKYEKMIRDFWWADEEGHRKVHWMSWERMIKPKRAGGLVSETCTCLIKRFSLNMDGDSFRILIAYVQES